MKRLLLAIMPILLVGCAPSPSSVIKSTPAETKIMLKKGEIFWGIRSKGVADNFLLCTHDKTDKIYYFRQGSDSVSIFFTLKLKPGEKFIDFQSCAEADRINICTQDSIGVVHIISPSGFD